MDRGKVPQCPGIATKFIEYNYGFDNELVSERFTVSEVLEILVNRVEPPELPFKENDDEPS